MLAPDTDPAALAGLELVDRRGERIGRVRQVYPEDGVLAWAGIRGNLIGTAEVLVPLADADLEDDVVTVPVSRSRVAAAPRRTPDAPLEAAERDDLRRFYEEVPAEPLAIVAPQPEAPRAAEASAAAVGTDGLDRSEQRIRVATEPVPRTRVVLRKVVITEQRTITVPVRREEVRLVREPIPDGQPVPGAVLEESEQQLVLHEERVVVTTEVVPIERVRLVREIVTEDREVTGEVWREQLETGAEPVPQDPAAPRPTTAVAATAKAAPQPAATADRAPQDADQHTDRPAEAAAPASREAADSAASDPEPASQQPASASTDRSDPARADATDPAGQQPTGADPAPDQSAPDARPAGGPST